MLRRTFLVLAGATGVALTTGCSGASPQDYFDDRRVVELIRAVQKRDRGRAVNAIAAGADPNEVGNNKRRDRAGMTPLLWLVEFWPPTASALMVMELGGDPLLVRPGFPPAVMYAQRVSNPEATEALVRARSNLVHTVDPRTGSTLLQQAILFGQDALVTFLVDHDDIDLDVQDRAASQTALHQAAVLNRSRICLRLIRAGANPEIRDSHGETFLTPLMRWEDRPITEESRREHQAVIAELRTRGHSTEY